MFSWRKFERVECVNVRHKKFSVMITMIDIPKSKFRSRPVFFRQQNNFRSSFLRISRMTLLQAAVQFLLQKQCISLKNFKCIITMGDLFPVSSNQLNLIAVSYNKAALRYRFIDFVQSSISKTNKFFENGSSIFFCILFWTWSCRHWKAVQWFQQAKYFSFNSHFGATSLVVCKLSVRQMKWRK